MSLGSLGGTAHGGWPWSPMGGCVLHRGLFLVPVLSWLLGSKHPVPLSSMEHWELLGSLGRNVISEGEEAGQEQAVIALSGWAVNLTLGGGCVGLAGATQPTQALWVLSEDQSSPGSPSHRVWDTASAW